MTSAVQRGTPDHAVGFGITGRERLARAVQSRGTRASTDRDRCGASRDGKRGAAVGGVALGMSRAVDFLAFVGRGGLLWHSFNQVCPGIRMVGRRGRLVAGSRL